MASVMIPPQVLLGLANNWAQTQTWEANVGGTINSQLDVLGSVRGYQGGGVAVGMLSVGDTPAQSTLTVTSGTVYQNTTDRYLSIDVAVYATTAGTAGTMAFKKGASSTPSTIWTRMVSSASTSTATDVQPIRIPPGFYWSLTLSGSTFGTITQNEE